MIRSWRNFNENGNKILKSIRNIIYNWIFWKLKTDEEKWYTTTTFWYNKSRLYNTILCRWNISFIFLTLHFYILHSININTFVYLLMLKNLYKEDSEKNCLYWFITKVKYTMNYLLTTKKKRYIISTTVKPTFPSQRHFIHPLILKPLLIIHETFKIIIFYNPRDFHRKS